MPGKEALMAFYKYRGKRIRASDKMLAYRFSVGSLLLLFVAVLLLLNMGQLWRTNWKSVSLIDGGFTLSPYLLFTVFVAVCLCALTAFLYARFCRDHMKQLMHRQKLSRMI